jgi:hypothetical protein
MEPPPGRRPCTVVFSPAPADESEQETEVAPVDGTTWESDADCPFHTVMGQFAQAAVRQQVLYLEGEVLPRSDLVDTLDGWHQLYRLVRTRVCPATRCMPLTSDDLATLVETAVPALLPLRVPASVRATLRRQLVACATCPSPQQCPLGLPATSDLPKEESR